jgi:hypothetical protein
MTDIDIWINAAADTEEGLHYPMAVTYYARIRLALNLLPLLRRATGLRRVVSVFTATKEGRIDTTDFQARHVPVLSQRGHTSSIMTLGLEFVAKDAPEVSKSKLPLLLVSLRAFNIDHVWG